MNSIISDDLSREHLALDAAKCIDNIFVAHQNVTALHKELLEINLSVTAYIQESKKRLEHLRWALAHEAKSSQKVVEILSEKFQFYARYHCNTPLKEKMSSTPVTPRKRNTRINIKSLQEDNNNTSNKFSERQQARTFMQWYKHMIDNERQNLGLYLADDASLEWFGRTIKTRKKVSSFMKLDMQCSRHDFTSVESIDKIQTRQESLLRKDDATLASPLHSPELIKSKDRCAKRRLLRSNCNSPEWAEGCQPEIEFETERKKIKPENQFEIKQNHEVCQNNLLKRDYPEETSEISDKGDGILKRVKRKCVQVTPPNKEVGQGDCMPSTSGTDSNKSHDALNAQLLKLAVECNGYIEFTRMRNNRSTDSMKWERKCKVQISYSEDPLNVGEYIIWALRYTDDSKCRRNLLAAFEEAAKDEEVKNVQ